MTRTLSQNLSQNCEIWCYLYYLFVCHLKHFIIMLIIPTIKKLITNCRFWSFISTRRLPTSSYIYNISARQLLRFVDRNTCRAKMSLRLVITKMYFFAQQLWKMHFCIELFYSMPLIPATRAPSATSFALHCVLLFELIRQRYHNGLAK